MSEKIIFVCGYLSFIFFLVSMGVILSIEDELCKVFDPKFKITVGKWVGWFTIREKDQRASWYAFRIAGFFNKSAEKFVKNS